MLKLSMRQHKLVRSLPVGEAVIKGKSQSGKTTFVAERMTYLLDREVKDAERVLVLTGEGSRSVVQERLARRERERNLSLFAADNEVGNASVETVETLFSQLVAQYNLGDGCRLIPCIPVELLEAALMEAKKVYPKVKWLRVEELDFIAAEYIWLYAMGIASLEVYEKAQRKGTTRKLPAKGNGRKAIWYIKEQLDTRLLAAKYWLPVQRDLAVAQFLGAQTMPTYDHLLIDDADLLTKVQLEVLGLLGQGTSGDRIFTVAKEKQTCYTAWLGMGNRFTTLGYNMRGKMKLLKKVEKKKKTAGAKKEYALTPLELFIQEQQELLQTKAKNTLPWYLDTYCYINRLTGVETHFEQDISAGESYIDQVKQETVSSLPIYSDIAAGAPIEIIEEECSFFDLPTDLIGNRKNTYMLHVQGDSMIGAGIEDGDHVVIQAGSVGPKEIAAVYYQGAITLKYIVEEDGAVLLLSKNPKYEPIRIEEEDFRVMGRLIGVLKQTNQ